MSFSSQGVAETKTQGLACSPRLSAALPRMPAFLPRLHAPPARPKKSSAPTGHIPRATSLGGLGHVHPAEQHTLRGSGAVACRPHAWPTCRQRSPWATLAPKLLWRPNNRLCHSQAPLRHTGLPRGCASPQQDGDSENTGRGFLEGSSCLSQPLPGHINGIQASFFS